MRFTHVILMVVVLFVLVPVVPAKTDLFGDGREAWLTASNDTIELAYGFRPLDKVSWGADLTLVREQSTTTAHVKTKDSLAGLYVTYPMMAATSLIEGLGMEATVSAKACGLVNMDRYDGIITKLGAVADIPVDDHVSIRLGYDLVAGTNTLSDEMVSAGFVARW